MPHMYILECSDGSFYVGSTWDADYRLAQHQRGEGSQYTKRRLPVKLVHCEYFERRDEAYWAEKQVQGWSRRKRLALIEGRAEELPGSTGRPRARIGEPPVDSR
ncbi:GIY-YIG nuclease family protein [Agrococcus sediminis]|uniref:GIY-YIG nuclease family protein n=1 Tax=Agrococcus sediminis TaxID=2599924 RepID=UPI00381B68CB